MTPPPWDRVAAPGTDPARLARVVAALAGSGWGGRSVLRRAAAHQLTAPDRSPGELVVAATDPPDDEALARAGSVASDWNGLGVLAAVVGDPAYPPRLAVGWPGTAGPPVLAWRGDATGIWERPAVAVVGARRATGYGTGVAAWLAEAAASAGALVVSGGAVGIDAAAHAAALGHPGGTAVVLGCGHGVAYPRAHAAPGGLFDRILAAGGLLVSEVPPRTRPAPGLVRARNRVVAGLSDGVVVVEGGDRSGALITAGVAADRGVQVLAVPGDVRAPGSAAPHRLLAEGATPCTSPRDLLDALGQVEPPQATLPGVDEGAAPVTTLPAAVHAELTRRWPRPVRIDELAQACGVAASALLAAVTRARIAGELAESADGVRLTRAPT